MHTDQNISCTPADQNISCTPTDQNISCTPTDQSISCTPTDQSISRTPTDQKISRTPTDQNISRTPTDQKVQDVIWDVTAVGAEGKGAGMAEDDRGGGDVQRVVHGVQGRVRQVHQHPQPVHLSHHTLQALSLIHI